MAERAPKLEWRQHAPSFTNTWLLGAELSAWSAGNWFVECHGQQAAHGIATTLLAAQLAAEDAALTWLREGVEALGGRVLTREQVALVERETRHDAATQLRSLAYVWREMDGAAASLYERDVIAIAGLIERGQTASMIDEDRAKKMLNREQAKFERDPLDWEF